MTINYYIDYLKKKESKLELKTEITTETCNDVKQIIRDKNVINEKPEKKHSFVMPEIELEVNVKSKPKINKPRRGRGKGKKQKSKV